MTRTRVAAVLGVVAVFAVLGTAAIAISRNDDGPDRVPDNIDEAGTLTVRDPATGASFEVPDGLWKVEERPVRIYYTDEKDRPVAVVRGPAVFRSGYCADRRDSNRAFAGFTRQGFAAWADELAGDGWTTGVDREQIELADGTPAEVARVGAFVGSRGPCGSDGVEVAMVEASGVRVVLVRDTGRDDMLPSEDVEAILGSLDLDTLS